MEDLIIVFAAKWRAAAQHNEHHNSHRPVVALRCIASLQNLWGYVVRSTIGCSHELVLRDFLGEPEVYQLNMRIVVLLV